MVWPNGFRLEKKVRCCIAKMTKLWVVGVFVLVWVCFGFLVVFLFQKRSSSFGAFKKSPKTQPMVHMPSTGRTTGHSHLSSHTCSNVWTPLVTQEIRSSTPFTPGIPPWHLPSFSLAFAARQPASSTKDLQLNCPTRTENTPCHKGEKCYFLRAIHWQIVESLRNN